MKRAALAMPAMSLAGAAAQEQKADALNPRPVRVGMTDWNLGQRGDRQLRIRDDARQQNARHQQRRGYRPENERARRAHGV